MPILGASVIDRAGPADLDVAGNRSAKVSGPGDLACEAAGGAIEVLFGCEPVLLATFVVGL